MPIIVIHIFTPLQTSANENWAECPMFENLTHCGTHRTAGLFAESLSKGGGSRKNAEITSTVL